MKKELVPGVLIALTLWLGCAKEAVAQSRSQRSSSGSLEVSIGFGAMIANKEIARGVNATGGHEQLIAGLENTGTLALRFGAHGDLFGMEGNIVTTLRPVVVDNEFGVGFPNHGGNPLICSADALFYFLGKWKQRVRPYVTSGIGGMWVSADLDNIHDQEIHNRLTWNTGGGAKVIAGENPDFFVDFRFTNHRLLGSQGSTDLRSFSVGIGYRF